VAFWDPKTKPAPLQPFRFSYNLYWTMGNDFKQSEDKVVATRVGMDLTCQDCRQFIIDFAGPGLDRLTETNAPEVVANSSGNAVILNSQVNRCPELGTWRAVLKMQPKQGNADPVDLRCTLTRGTNTLSETWTYQWSPP
jgi:glucans biosynthesis protein